MTNKDELSPRQHRAIAAVLEGQTREGAAKAAGVSVRTLRRWATSEPFARELARQRSWVLDAAATVLVAGAAEAARALVATAVSSGARADAARVSAARAVLDLAVDFDARSELVRRLDALEKAISGDDDADQLPEGLE